MSVFWNIVLGDSTDLSWVNECGNWFFYGTGSGSKPVFEEVNNGLMHAIVYDLLWLKGVEGVFVTWFHL